MKVLLADDDAFMRLFLEEVLGVIGHEVVTAADGEAAWTAFLETRPPMVILDWQMPLLDGLELCKRIKADDSTRHTFVLMVTARDGAEDLASVLDAGADDYMAKPVTPENLQARLRIAERRIAVDAARREAEGELQRARYLAGIGETTLTIQHEINNPLAALITNAGLIQSGMLDAAESAESVEVIVEQARRIADVVKRLAKLENPKSVEYLQGARMIELSKRGFEADASE